MSDPMDKLLAALLRQTKAMSAQTAAINALAASNERLADAILAGEPEQVDGEEGFIFDMAGNRVEVLY